MMKGFVQGGDRQQTTLLPECLDDWVDESNSIRAVDVFVDALDLRDLGFDGVDPAATGRPAYHPSPMLKLYIYGYLNRVQSSRRLEREAGRNLEVMWLTGRLAPDHKTIADFRKDNGAAIRKVCAQFVELCRKMGLLAKEPAGLRRALFFTIGANRDASRGGIGVRHRKGATTIIAVTIKARAPVASEGSTYPANCFDILSYDDWSNRHCRCRGKGRDRSAEQSSKSHETRSHSPQRKPPLQFIVPPAERRLVQKTVSGPPG